ncbi:hypothetical protein N9L68_07215 [bacterium]|nr:hypothetical protein [bacterium]
MCRLRFLGMFSAAAAIDEFIEMLQTEQVVPNAGWLAVPPAALPPVMSTSNPMFPHLPEETFHIAVKFRRGLGKWQVTCVASCTANPSLWGCRLCYHGSRSPVKLLSLACVGWSLLQV